MHAESQPSPAEGKRRWVARHPLWSALILVVALLLLVLGYAGYQSWRMADGLMQVRDAAASIEQAVGSGDPAQMQAAVESIQDPAAEANARAENWSVRALTGLPVFGGDVEAARALAYAADTLAEAAPTALAALPDFDGEGLEALTPERAAELDRAIVELRDSVADAFERLDSVDADTLRVSQLREQLPRLTDALGGVEAGLDRAQPLLGALPLIASPDGERTWLVINQNLTEARGSGGLLSAYAVLRADGGKIKLLTQGSNDDLNRMGPADDSSAPDGLREFWGDELTTWWGLNQSAHFPTTGRIVTESWNKLNRVKVDGVVALGQGTMQYLAAAAGPIEVRGETIEPEDLADYLTVGLYRDYPDPKEKDEVAAEIIGELFGRIAAGDLDVSRLLRTAFTVDNPDYVQMWSADADDAERIAAAGLAGELPDSYGPVTSVRVVNASGNKLEAFMQLEVSYELGACIADEEASTTRESTMTVRITNNAPSEGLPDYMTGRLELPEGEEYVEGSTRELMLVYPPVDAVEEELFVDGEQAPAAYGQERNREFVAVPLDIAPGETRTLSARWTEPAEGEEGGALSAQPRVIMPPLINQPTVYTPAGKRCSVPAAP